MSDTWPSSLPTAPRRGSTKTYFLSDEHKQWLKQGFEFAEHHLKLFVPGAEADRLVKALKNGFNYETVDEGFVYKEQAYTILAISHKGQTSGESSWVALEPHVAKRDISFGMLTLGLSATAPDGFYPARSNFDTLADGKVIPVTRCHFTPDGRPLGVCRKEDRVATTQKPAAPSVDEGAKWANAWGAPAAPAAQSDAAPF